MKLSQNFKYFILGVGSVLAIVFLSGASDYSSSALHFGRYQLSSCGTQLNSNSGMIGAFVIDTVSGETRTVYVRSFGATGKSKILKNNLNKPFSAMK